MDQQPEFVRVLHCLECGQVFPVEDHTLIRQPSDCTENVAACMLTLAWCVLGPEDHEPGETTPVHNPGL